MAEIKTGCAWGVSGAPVGFSYGDMYANFYIPSTASIFQKAIDSMVSMIITEVVLQQEQVAATKSPGFAQSTGYRGATSPRCQACPWCTIRWGPSSIGAGSRR